ncbi:MAG: lactonase family protein [Saprospiraceae bacterium]
MKLIIRQLLCCSLVLSSCQSASEGEQKAQEAEAGPSPVFLFIGTYTPKEAVPAGKASGIYVYKMDTEHGTLTKIDSIEGPLNPSYLAIHPNGRYLYAVNEMADGTDAVLGQVSAFSIDAGEMKFQKLNTVSAQGDAPCHLTITPDGKHLLVANYVGGNIAAFPIASDGALGEATSVVQHEGSGPDKGRQKEPHAHMVKLFPIGENNFVSVDLGIDRVLHYQLDENTGQINGVAETPTSPGAGPRHLDFHPKSSWVYVVNELNHTIEVFHYTTILAPFERKQTISTLSEGSQAQAYPGAIKVHPNGRFLYASNRGQTEEENSIAMYQIDAENGQLTFLGVQSVNGSFPRDFEIDPSGKFLLVANQKSNNVVVYTINLETGTLEETELDYEINTPVCLKFLTL